MPYGDKSGPLGNGPGTGRRLGFCYNQSSQDGLGLRRGRGNGFGSRLKGFAFTSNNENPPFYQNSKDELSQLKKMKENLEQRIANIEKDLAD